MKKKSENNTYNIPTLAIDMHENCEGCFFKRTEETPFCFFKVRYSPKAADACPCKECLVKMVCKSLYNCGIRNKVIQEILNNGN